MLRDFFAALRQRRQYLLGILLLAGPTPVNDGLSFLATQPHLLPWVVSTCHMAGTFLIIGTFVSTWLKMKKSTAGAG